MSEPIDAEEAHYWRALVENSPDVILVVDTDGTAVFINRVRPPFQGRQIVGAKIWEFAAGAAEERIRAVLRKIVETRESLRYEAPGFGPDGGEAWFEVSVIPLVTNGRVERVLWNATDVTVRKRLEEHVRQSQKMEAIGQLAGGVAHDFNNLLAVILGRAELAALRVPAGHSLAEEIQEVTHAAKRAAALTRKLLAFSRKQIIQSRPLDLRAAVSDFVTMLGRIVGEDVEIVVESDEAPDGPVVHADAVQIEQVLLNLCTNARQAMPGGGLLRLRTQPVTLDDAFVRRNPWARVGSFAELAVADTGVGMDAATQARAFEPFFTTRPEGTGLGLATVYGIVQQHRGFVHVESSPGAGTTFRVYVPLATAESVPAPSLSPEPPGVRRGGRELILLAEDEPSLRALVVATLSALGYCVIATGNGEEALAEFQRRAGDVSLVILDVVMPRMDACTAYERMRAIRPDVKVLFMTGYAPESTRLGELLQGARGELLEKPFTPHALATTVRRMLD